MNVQDMINAAQSKAADLQKQIDGFNEQIASLTAQRDLHNAAATSLLSISDEQKNALNMLITENGNG
jgi:hypothetical protein